MEDTKVIAAIITASIALFLGLINFIFNIVSLRSRNRNQLEVELLKTELEKEKIKFEDSLKKKEKEETNKSVTVKRILNTLQVLKDSCYSVINNLNQSKEQYLLSLENLKLSLSSSIGVYQETYMDMENDLRHDMHETKNFLHYSRVIVEKELIRNSHKMNIKERIPKIEIVGLIEKVTIIQNRLLNENE